MGNRVLVIDLDEQANASLLLGVNKAEEIDNASSLEEIEQILDSFAGRKELVDFLKADKHQFHYQDYIYRSQFNNFMTLYDKGHIDVLPSSYRTKDTGLGDKPFRDRLLNQGLQSSNMAKDYDYIIIDTPPSYTDITWNGVSAAQYMIIPSQMEYLSAYGINNPIKQVKEVEQITDGKRGKIIGIVPMMANNTNLYKTIKQLIQNRFKHIPILQEIRDSTYVGESLKCRNPMTEYAQRTGKGQDIAYQFQALTQQIIENINTIEKTESN
jgi:chromosome partitioning protein